MDVVVRGAKAIRNAAGIKARLEVEPELIPSYLALVGHSADGTPGIADICAVTAARPQQQQHGPVAWFQTEGLAPDAGRVAVHGRRCLAVARSCASALLRGRNGRGRRSSSRVRMRSPPP